MMDIILKLKEKRILKEGTMIDAIIDKNHMGSPIQIRSTLRIKEIHNDYCIADEEFDYAAEVPYRKIQYQDIITIDGMRPRDLAAVYNLAPKTARFKKEKRHK
jgi:hypothetical protein